LWNTLSGVGPYKLYFVDEKTGQAGLFAAIEENGRPARISLRLKIEEGRISEVETVVIREQNAPFGLLSNARSAPDPIWSRSVPVRERHSRLELLQIANQYFEGVENKSGDLISISADTVRWENGVQTAPPTGPRILEGPDGSVNMQGLSIAESFNLNSTSATHPVSPRRFLIVDEERGLVYGAFFMNHIGNVDTYDVPGVGTLPASEGLHWPSTGQIMEVFKIENGEIVAIEAEFMLIAYRQWDGWSELNKPGRL
jgi:hypothetical protein